MKFTLYSTIIYGLLFFAVGAGAAPILGASVDARAVSTSHDLSSRALPSGESELVVERALLPGDSVLEERMGEIEYDEGIYGRALDELYDLSYRSPSPDVVPSLAEQKLHAPPQPRYGRGQENHLVKRGIKDFFKKVWGGIKNVAKKAVGFVKNVVSNVAGGGGGG